MTTSKTTPKPDTASPAKAAAVAGKKPTAVAHLAAASQHAAAEHHHLAAAHKLNQGEHAKAKDHAKAAASHSGKADQLTTDTIILYEIWEI